MANNKEQNVGDWLTFYVHEGCQSCQAILSCTTSQVNQI